jgi:hypothetical protein
MRMTATLGLACLLLLAVPLIGAQPPGAAEEAEEAPKSAAGPEAATTGADAADAAGEAGESDAAAAGGEVEASFSPTERVPADASIRFPVDI